MSSATNVGQDHRQEGPEYSTLRIINPHSLTPAERIPGLREVEVIGSRTVAAQQLWVAHVLVGPAVGVSPVHHHGTEEGVFYVLRGQITFFFGDGLHQRVDAYPGDCVFVPAWAVHAEANLGDEETELLAIRAAGEASMFMVANAQVPGELLQVAAPSSRR